MPDKKGKKTPPKTTPRTTYDNVHSKNESVGNEDDSPTVRNTIPPPDEKPKKNKGK